MSARLGLPVRRVGLVTAVLLALFAWPVAARAAVTVTTTDDRDAGECQVGDCTLREAVRYSADGETIIVPAGDYTLTLAQLEIAHGVTILGDSAGTTTIHGTASHRAIFVDADVNADLEGVTITDGDADDAVGGGLRIESGASVLLNDVAVTGNHALDGAGIWTEGSLAVDGSTIAGNHAGRNGGGIYTAGSATLTVDATTVSGNNADADGGGLFLLGTPTLTNSTVSGNGALADGGGIWAGNTLEFTNVTIADNQAESGGGIQYQVDTQIAHGTNNILVRNLGGSCSGIASQISSTFTMSDDASCTAGSPSNRFVTDPKLGALADNGGPTRTQLPQDGSEAIDNGNDDLCPAFDQRGEPRPGGAGCDIGAVEVQPPPGTLHVVTTVEGGVWQVGDFTSRVDGEETNFRAGSSTGADYTLPPGPHTLTAEGARGYQATIGGACSGTGAVTITAGQTTTCTIAEHDVAVPDAGLVIESYGPTRTDFDWGLTEPFLAQTRGYLNDAAAFGPSGVVRKSWIVAPGIREANARTLAGVDVFFTGWVPTFSYNAAEKQALRDFVANGGTLIATTDDTGHSMVDAFGLTQADGSGSPTENVITAPAHAIANGAFGNVSTYRQYDATGNYSALGPNAHEIGRYASGAGTTIAVIERGALGPGFGRGDLRRRRDLQRDADQEHLRVRRGRGRARLGDAAEPTSSPTTAARRRRLVLRLAEPEPEIHKTAVAEPAGGTVKIKVPGSNKFIELKAGEEIPLGTIVDTRKGRVTLVAAADKSGGTATADFYSGLFKVGQTKGSKPITELTLVEKLSCKSSGKKASAAKKKVRKRRLWGDGHGHFRTKGSNSAATVLGTKWLVQDTCSSTLTRVARGVVSVRDFAKKKTVKVKAGHKYVARAKH